MTARKPWSRPEAATGRVSRTGKNKPIALADGSILAPTSFEDRGWRVHFKRTTNLGRVTNRQPA